MVMQKLLIRQLAREEFSEDALPIDVNKWQEFLKRVNQAYIDAEQERDMLERSMTISSQEMRALNSKLENAQHIARMAYWNLDVKTRNSNWSKELYTMLGFDPSLPPPGLARILNLTHESDRSKLQELMQNAMLHGKDYETQVRLKNSDGSFKWFHVIGNTCKNEQGEVTEVSGIVLDITKRKEAEEEVIKLHEQLLNSARRAGMADVATSILHNVGNVLNSVNVSLNMINEYLSLGTLNKLIMTLKLIKEHEENIDTYFKNDEKGKLIPKYLTTLSNKFIQQYENVANEVKNLSGQIEHIKEITVMQRTISGVGGLNEKIFLPDIIDTAINMCSTAFQKKNIKIIKNYLEIPFIVTDKSKLMQILMNLLQNAQDALIELKNNVPKELAITIKLSENAQNIEIAVKDNGIGVAPENITKIFSFGFTTKENGHGFGLHSSALAAKEMGGSLIAASSGYGCGTEFKLTLPLTAPRRRSEHEQQAKSENYSH